MSMMNRMREIEYFIAGNKKRLVYQITVEEENLQIHSSWTHEEFSGVQMSTRGHATKDALEEELKTIHDNLIAAGYTQVPFGYTEQMSQFEDDIEDMRRAEAHQ